MKQKKERMNERTKCPRPFTNRSEGIRNYCRNTTEEGKALPVNCAQRGLKLTILLQDCDVKYNMVEYAKRQLERLKKLQRNDKEDVTTRDLRNDTMRKEEINWSLYKQEKRIVKKERRSSLKSCPNR